MFRSLLIILALCGATAAAAQLQTQAPPVGYAGELVSYTDESVSLKDQEGKTVVVAMTRGWTVSRPRAIESAGIRNGDFIASANKPVDEHTGRSTEVRIMEAGYRPEFGTHMMAQSENAMTHGTVAKITRSAAGLELEVTYPGGSRKLIVPGDVKVTDFELLDRSVLKPGTKVSAVTRKGTDGVARAGRLTLPAQA